MTHEGPNKIKQNGDYSPEINVTRARDAINRLLLKMSPDMDLETQKQQVIHHIEDRLWNLFPENQAALDQLIEELRSAHFSNKKEMVNKIANQIGSFMTAISSPKELETKFREMTTERHRWTTLNDILSYELYGDNEINLHVLTMLSKNPR